MALVYIPIMCCGEEMAEIWKGDERIAAVCQICKKVWHPKKIQYVSLVDFGVEYKVTGIDVEKVDDKDIEELIEKVTNKVNKALLLGHEKGENDE